MNVVAHIDVNASFFRNECWNVLRRAFRILDKKLKEKGMGPIGTHYIARTLLNAGIVQDYSVPYPYARLAPIANKGKVVRFKVYEDGTLDHEFLQEKPCATVNAVGKPSLSSLEARSVVARPAPALPSASNTTMPVGSASRP